MEKGTGAVAALPYLTRQSNFKSRSMTSQLERAITIATEAHCKQLDKAGAPYILHPLRVMSRFNSEAERIVAVLHDVVEDTDWTLERLSQEGFSAEVVQAVDCVTRREGESYDDFVKRSAANPLARRVKIADLEDNMDIRRLEAVIPKDAERLNKYLQAWKYLNDCDAHAPGS